MFVNFSNHPSEKWPKKQIAAASAYGQIRDVPFPVVPANADEILIESLADESVEKILSAIREESDNASQGEDASVQEVHAVMAQGEFTLTFCVVQKLIARGITVLSACSERSVRERVSEDGKMVKEVQFGFVRFRKYRMPEP